MKLLDAYTHPQAVALLYELLAERPRENWISHAQMPSMRQHKAFVRSRPFRYWLLIEVDGTLVGAMEATKNNEIGVSLLKAHQGRGYGAKALKLFIKTHRPKRAIPAIRNGHWLANIAVTNEGSKAFFRKQGFKPLQETWQL